MPETEQATVGPINVLFDLPEVTIRHRWVSEMCNNVYLITSKKSGTQVLIDAADNPQAILELIDSASEDSPCQTTLACIIITHEHWDHIQALADISDRTATPVAAGTEDAESIEKQTGVRPQALLNHGQEARINGISLDVIGLRGHTPGSVALAYECDDNPTIIFSGDSLFPGGVGNTFDDAERFTSLFNDVKSRVFDVYEDDTVILPGHGDFTTLGKERPHLAEWRERGW